jgi:hypothetical protein
MRYVITEKETGIQYIFKTFTDVMSYIQKWHGDIEMSDEQKQNTFIERHRMEIIYVD